jgi:hypothetical protein
MEVGRIIAALYSKLEGIEQEIRLLERAHTGPARAANGSLDENPMSFENRATCGTEWKES